MYVSFHRRRVHHHTIIVYIVYVREMTNYRYTRVAFFDM